MPQSSKKQAKDCENNQVSWSGGKIRQQNGENRFSSWNTPVGHDNAKYCKWNEKIIHFILPHQITVRNSICHS